MSNDQCTDDEDPALSAISAKGSNNLVVNSLHHGPEAGSTSISEPAKQDAGFVEDAREATQRSHQSTSSPDDPDSRTSSNGYQLVAEPNSTTRPQNFQLVGSVKYLELMKQSALILRDSRGQRLVHQRSAAVF